LWNPWKNQDNHLLHFDHTWQQIQPSSPDSHQGQHLSLSAELSTSNVGFIFADDKNYAGPGVKGTTHFPSRPIQAEDY
jgi:hypothetical protein